MTGGPPLRPFALTAAALCVLALADLPYGYYTALRFAVCGTAAYGAVVAGGGRWSVALALVAVVFNPVFPVHLDRGTWAAVDIAAAAVLAAAGLRADRWRRAA